MEPSSPSDLDQQKLALKQAEAISELEMRIAQQHLNMRSGEHRRRQLETELHQIVTNRTAADREISRLEAELTEAKRSLGEPSGKER